MDDLPRTENVDQFVNNMWLNLEGMSVSGSDGRLRWYLLTSISLLTYTLIASYSGTSNYKEVRYNKTLWVTSMILAGPSYFVFLCFFHRYLMRQPDYNKVSFMVPRTLL